MVIDPVLTPLRHALSQSHWAGWIGLQVSKALSCSSGLVHLILFFNLGIAAQTYKVIPPQSEVQPYLLQVPTEQMGMNGAVQTPDGFLWIGSGRGLILSDGHRGIVYRQDDPMFNLALDHPDAFIGDFHLDSLGFVYAAVSTGTSIIRMHPGTRAIDARWPMDRKDNPNIISFSVSPQGQVFTLSEDKEEGTFSIWKMDTSGHHQLLTRQSLDQYGEVQDYQWFQSMHWVQTLSGILRITGDGLQVDFFPFPKENSGNFIRPYTGKYYLFYDEGRHALMYWDATMDQPRQYTMLKEGLNVTAGSMLVQHEKVYIANGYYFMVLDTLQRTIEDLSEQTFKMKKEFYPEAISEDILEFLLIDQQVYLLGSKYLYKLKSQPVDKEYFFEPIPFKRPDVSLRGLAEDEHQRVYASFYSSVVVKDKGETAFKAWAPLRHIDTDRYSAYSLTYRSPYLFWHSLRIHAASGELKQIIPNQTNGHVVQWLSGDTLWLYSWYRDHLYGYDIGADHLDSIRIESLVRSESSFPSVINKMIGGSSPFTIWMATQENGIVLVSTRGKILQSYMPEQLGMSRKGGVYDIMLDGSNMWYGCSEGLGRINLSTGERILFKDPIVSHAQQQSPRTIFAILPDEQAGFYLGSQRGLVYFDTSLLQFAHLHQEHPLAQPEFNRMAAFKDSQGRFYFGSTNGLYSFLPEELEFQRPSATLYPIKLYGIAVFNGKKKQYRYLTAGLSELNALVLQPSETNIEFHLSVPCYDQEVYYSYRIKGLQDDWSEYTPDPHIVVYGLPSGRYVLEVRASAQADMQLASSFTLPIHMKAFWYQKIWVWVLITIGIIAFVTFWIRYWYVQQWKRQQELEALRIKISSDLHDDVGSILSGLAMQSQVMSYEMDESKRSPLLELSEMSREAMERMRDTVWAIDARKDKYENLVDRMRDFAEKNLERKNITHTFTFTGLDGKKFISPEVRQNVYLIFKEAITNVIRHSIATNVEINLSARGEHLILVVHDNGGLVDSNFREGQGIGNMMMRALKIGGRLDIRFENGFKVVLEVG